MSTELKPCPFCDGPARIVKGDGPFCGRAQVECVHCRIATFWYDERVAVRQWNRRTVSDSRYQNGVDVATGLPQETCPCGYCAKRRREARRTVSGQEPIYQQRDHEEHDVWHDVPKKQYDSLTDELSRIVYAAPVPVTEPIPAIMYNGDTKRDPALRDRLNRQITDAMDAAPQHSADIDAMRRDAERYRFLKAGAERLDYDAGWRSCWQIKSVDISAGATSLDAAIDAALQGKTDADQA